MFESYNVQKYGKILFAVAAISMFSYTSIQIYRNNMVLKSGKSKFILLWSKKDCRDCAPVDLFDHGNHIFRQKNCTYQNCYIVQNTMDLPSISDPSEYDAIIFIGRPLRKIKPNELPKLRRPEQIYIFVQIESSARFPVYSKMFDDFFNWTVTYRLDSDIPWPYFRVQNRLNQTIGPSMNVPWERETEMQPIEEELREKINGKTKLAALFISNCESSSGRIAFVNNLTRVLREFNQTVDVYGRCGHLSCPKWKKHKCFHMVERDYLFYLSMENSLSVDYVTEKVLTALQNYAIPVVYGGADYSRFLPPGSYINARALGAETLASTMVELMLDRFLTYEYFQWRRHYTYFNNLLHARNCACDVCEGLNERAHIQKRYKKFRKWWNSYS